MTAVLVRKLLRDMRLALLVVALLLAAFQCLWARITERILGDLSPFFRRLAAFGGMTEKNVQEKLFEGYYNFRLTERLRLSFNLERVLDSEEDGQSTFGYFLPGVRLQASF